MLRLSVYSPPLEGRRTAAGGGGVTAVSEDLASVNNHSVCGVSLPNGGQTCQWHVCASECEAERVGVFVTYAVCS